MNAAIELDEISRLVTCDATVRWADLEARVNEVNLTLGYYNEKHSGCSLETLLQKKMPNLLYRKYGHPVDGCVGVLMRGRDQRVYRTLTVPRTAAGPDFRRLLLGLGKQWGELEEVTLRVHALPESIVWHWSYWPTVKQANGLVDELEAIHVIPSLARTYSEDDKRILLGLRFSGISGMVRCYRERASALTGAMGGKVIRPPRSKMEPLIKEFMEVRA